MQRDIRNIIRAHRLSLGISQAEAASRAGIQQRQVSLFERGGDVTLSTLMKLAQALDVELVVVPRKEVARVDALLTGDVRPITPERASPPPSLLDRYQVNDEESPYG